MVHALLGLVQAGAAVETPKLAPLLAAGRLGLHAFTGTQRL